MLTVKFTVTLCICEQSFPKMNEQSQAGKNYSWAFLWKSGCFHRKYLMCEGKEYFVLFSREMDLPTAVWSAVFFPLLVKLCFFILHAVLGHVTSSSRWSDLINSIRGKVQRHKLSPAPLFFLCPHFPQLNPKNERKTPKATDIDPWPLAFDIHMK